MCGAAKPERTRRVTANRDAASHWRSPAVSCHPARGRFLEKLMEITNRKQPKPRILARQLARPVTEDEKAIIAGGAAKTINVGAVRLTAGCDTWSCTGCPVNDSDS